MIAGDGNLIGWLAFAGAKKLAGARRCFRRAPLSIRRPVSRVLYSTERRLRAWRPFLCDAGCPAPEATYPDGAPDMGWALRPGAVPIRSCSRWGLPCRFRRRKRGALLPHRFTLAPAERYAPRRSVLCGTVPGVCPAKAGSAPPDVIRHRLSMEPGLSSPAAFRHWPERPSGRL